MNDFIAALEEQLVTAHRERRSRRRPIPWRGGAIVLAAAATVAAVVAVVIALASPDAHRAGSEPQQQQQTPPQTTPVHPESRKTVAVLNGTTITGLARTVSSTLTANGFREGVVTNDATNQQRRRTTIYYEPGYKEQAQSVAGCIGSGLDRVLPMDANARVAADHAPIAVFVGADLAQ
jgi:LytR cell envelope-related transcriptional attenuator